MPYAANLEKLALPSVAEVVAAAKRFVIGEEVIGKVTTELEYAAGRERTCIRI